MTSNAYEQAFAQTRFSQATGWNSLNSINADPLRALNRIVYNAGIAKESYFRSHSAQTGGFNIGDQSSIGGRNGLWRILQTDSAGNIPAGVSTATELWSKSQAYKGMLSTYNFPGKPSTDDKAAAKTSPAITTTDGISYGFQFHYNPTSVSMTYGGVPDIDPTMYTSGTEKFNMLGSSISGSFVTFNLILNRINDMKYFDPVTGGLKAGVSANAFSGRPPTARELSDIYNRGTMYDVEFLLRTIVGITLESALERGMSWDKKTADLGWLTGKPVELHLGKSLRYLGRIEGVQLTHVLFTERMVPMFTEVAITLQRIPDYVPSTLNAINQGAAAAPDAFTQIGNAFAAGQLGGGGILGGIQSAVGAAIPAYIDWAKGFNQDVINNFTGGGE